MKKTDELLEGSEIELIKKAEADEITLWSEDKKKEFADTFKARATAARYILYKTAARILENAARKHFIGANYANEVKLPSGYYAYNDMYDAGHSYHSSNRKVGGRSDSDLNEIAKERADLILAELPPVRKAVMVMHPLTAKQMEEKDVILKKLKKLKAEVEELAGPIKMATVDQKMTVGDFRKFVKSRHRQRQRIFEKMDELGAEGNVLEDSINRALFKGLPGLREAVISVAQQHAERAAALDTMTRRVQERIIFGDSEAAMEMLKGFEKDEVTVSSAIKEEFRSAMEKLKLAKSQLTAGRKKKKQLTAGKKKKGAKK